MQEGAIGDGDVRLGSSGPGEVILPDLMAILSSPTSAITLEIVTLLEEKGSMASVLGESAGARNFDAADRHIVAIIEE